MFLYRYTLTTFIISIISRVVAGGARRATAQPTTLFPKGCQETRDAKVSLNENIKIECYRERQSLNLVIYKTFSNFPLDNDFFIDFPIVSIFTAPTEVGTKWAQPSPPFFILG